MRRTRGASAAGKKSLPKKSLPRMNADKPVSRLRDWLNARVGHRHICVYLRQKFFSSWSPSRSQMHPEKAQALRARTRRQNRPNHAIQTIPY
jgi:hypothetical protein